MCFFEDFVVLVDECDVGVRTCAAADEEGDFVAEERERG